MITKQGLRRFLNDYKDVEYLSDKYKEEIILEAEKIIEKEDNLVRIDGKGAIFVGDTHGDLDATQKVISRYLNRNNTVVFLGDYVDRGKKSMENINYLLIAKILYPENLMLLQGNHEAIKILKFYPADFWYSLSGKFYDLYSNLLSKLPLVVTTKNGIIALHGSLPNVSNLSEINRIERGSELWREITWGDLCDIDENILGDDPMTGRPRFGRGYFNKIMRSLGMNILIRSHQPSAKTKMFDDRCITIFTSDVYSSERSIVISDVEKKVKNADDVSILFL